MTRTCFLTSADAASLLGVTPAAVRLMVQRQELPVAAETLGGIRLFERGDVEALARKRAEDRRPDGAWGLLMATAVMP